MNLWPFSKKDKKGESTDLPQGVVLASSETSDTLAHSVESYAEMHEPPAPTHDVPEAMPQRPPVSAMAAMTASDVVMPTPAHRAQVSAEPQHYPDVPSVWPPIVTGSEPPPAMPQHMPAQRPQSVPPQAQPPRPAQPTISENNPVAQHLHVVEASELTWSSSGEFDDFIEPTKPLPVDVLFTATQGQLQYAPTHTGPGMSQPEDLDDWLPSTESTHERSPVQESHAETSFWESVAPQGTPSEAADDFFAPPDIRVQEPVEALAIKPTVDLPSEFRDTREDDWIEPSATLAAAAHEALHNQMAVSAQEPDDLLDYVDHSDSLSELYQTPEHTSDTWLTDVLAGAPRPANGTPENNVPAPPAAKPSKPPRLKGFKEPEKVKEAPKKSEARKPAPVPAPAKPADYKPMALKPSVPSAPRTHVSSAPPMKPGESRIVPEGYLARQNANPLAPYQDNLSENLERFGRAVIREETQFMKRSIDDLVAGYFSQQDGDEDA